VIAILTRITRQSSLFVCAFLVPSGTKYDEEGATLRALSRREDAQCTAADDRPEMVNIPYSKAPMKLGEVSDPFPTDSFPVIKFLVEYGYIFEVGSSIGHSRDKREIPP
jgi:hypothetical protein